MKGCGNTHLAQQHDDCLKHLINLIFVHVSNMRFGMERAFLFGEFTYIFVS